MMQPAWGQKLSYWCQELAIQLGGVLEVFQSFGQGVCLGEGRDLLVVLWGHAPPPLELPGLFSFHACASFSKSTSLGNTGETASLNGRESNTLSFSLMASGMVFPKIKSETVSKSN